MRHFSRLFLLGSACLASVAGAQTPGPVLTLEQAVQIALRNSPTHLLVLSQRNRANNSLRASYGTFLPTISSSFGVNYRAGGNEVFAGQQFGATSNQIGSNYSIGISGSYSLSALHFLRAEQTTVDASDADVRASEQSIRLAVAGQYIGALQAEARAALQDTLLISAQAQLDLARAKQQVGVGTSLEVRNAEVQVGRQQVAILRERTNAENAVLQLYQVMGVPIQEGTRLTSSFPLTEPKIQLAELLDMARTTNPALAGARAREWAARSGVTAARSQYFPRLGFSTGMQGYTQRSTNIEPAIAQQRASAIASRASCFTQDSLRVGAGLAPSGRDCNAIAFTDAEASALRARNDQYPFGFTKQPFSYAVSLSLPLFDGFRREQAMQDADAQRNEARYNTRKQELQIATDVTIAYRLLNTSYQTVKLNEQVEQTAKVALQLAQERYRVGANTFLDVTNAQSQYQQAATDLVNSIYDFHKAYAQLESAVGRPLR